MKVIEELLGEQAVELDLIDDKGNTAIHTAVLFEQPSVLECLIWKGIPLETPNKRCLTALHVAVLTSSDNCSEILLKNGADINAKIEHPKHLLPLAAGNRTLEVSMQLTDAAYQLRYEKINRNFTFGTTPLHCPVTCGNSDVVRLLLVAGASLERQDVRMLMPLHHAVLFNDIDAVRSLLMTDVSMESQDARMLTPSQMAVRRGTTDINNVLLIRVRTLIIVTTWEYLCI